MTAYIGKLPVSTSLGVIMVPDLETIARTNLPNTFTTGQTINLLPENISGEYLHLSNGSGDWASITQTNSVLTLSSSTDIALDSNVSVQGNLAISGTAQVTESPVGVTDVTNKDYVDTSISGAITDLDVGTIARTNLSNTFDTTQIIDCTNGISYPTIPSRRVGLRLTGKNNRWFTISQESSNEYFYIDSSGTLFIAQKLTVQNALNCNALGATSITCTGFSNSGASTFTGKANLLNGATTVDPVLDADVVPKSYVDNTVNTAVTNLDTATIARTNLSNTFTDGQVIDLDTATLSLNTNRLDGFVIKKTRDERFTDYLRLYKQLGGSIYFYISAEYYDNTTGKFYQSPGLYFPGSCVFQGGLVSNTIRSQSGGAITVTTPITFNNKANFLNGATTIDPVLDADIVPKSYVDTAVTNLDTATIARTNLSNTFTKEQDINITNSQIGSAPNYALKVIDSSYATYDYFFNIYRLNDSYTYLYTSIKDKTTGNTNHGNLTIKGSILRLLASSSISISGPCVFDYSTTFKLKSNFLNGATTIDPVLDADIVPKSYVDTAVTALDASTIARTNVSNIFTETQTINLGERAEPFNAFTITHLKSGVEYRFFITKSGSAYQISSNAQIQFVPNVRFLNSVTFDKAITATEKSNLLNGATIAVDPVLADDAVRKSYVDYADSNLKALLMPYYAGLTNASDLFKNNKNLIEFDFPMPKCTSFYSAFQSSSLKTIGQSFISNLNPNITNVGGMFAYCESLEGPVPNLNLSNCTDFGSLFSGCSKLVGTIPLLNFGKAVATNAVFYSCSGLTGEIPLLDLSKATVTNHMFVGCIGLTGAIPEFNLDNCTNASSMFQNCNKLTSLTTLTVTKLTKAKDMFRNCGLDKQSIINMLNCLPQFTGVQDINTGDGVITFSGCPGVATMTPDDWAIGEAKGWLVQR